MVASRANEPRFRGSKNTSFDLEFFFYSRSLDRHDLMLQLLHSLAILASTRIQTLMTCSDASGSSSSMLSLLRDRKLLGDSMWKSKDITFFEDPIPSDTSNEKNDATVRFSVHNQKPLRSVLLDRRDDKDSPRRLDSAGSVALA